MGKNIIRLTESELKEIIKESVKKIIQESGDTLKGQYLYGKAARRQEKLGNKKRAEELNDYARNKSMEHLIAKRKGGLFGEDDFEDEFKRNARDASFEVGYKGAWQKTKDVLNGMKKHSAFADL